MTEYCELVEFPLHMPLLNDKCLISSQLKVDKMKLMEICGTSDTEFGNVCHPFIFFSAFVYFLDHSIAFPRAPQLATRPS